MQNYCNYVFRLCRQFSHLPLKDSCSSHSRHISAAIHAYQNPFTIKARNGSTFTNMTIEQLWDGCSGVSNAGKKRGRGKRGSSKRRIDLFAGKSFGYSKSNQYVYPGLNAAVLKGNELIQPATNKKDPDSEKKIIELRDSKNKFSRTKKWPIERGWSGNKLAGMSVGPPDPMADCDFKDFDSKVLEFKLVSHMTGNQGRKHSYSSFVVVGNKKGLFGMALAKASLGQASVRKAKNMAVQRLQHIELRESRTLWHSFHMQVGSTHVYASPKPEGYGLVCHRAIKTIAESIGIQDLYCKVEGATKNIQNVADAFTRGLLSQENHQMLADRMKYYVVELSDNYNVPKLLAAPNDGQVKDKPLEHFDIVRHYLGGKTVLRKGRRIRFYEKLGSYKRYSFIRYKRRNQHRLATQRRAAAIKT